MAKANKPFPRRMSAMILVQLFRARTVLATLSLVCLLWLSNQSGLAAEQSDPFAVENTKQEGAKASKKGKPAPIDRRIDFDITITPKMARRGETVQLTVAGTPRPGFHTYPLTQRSADPAQDPGQLSTLQYGAVQGLQPLWPVDESTPQPKHE